MIQCKNKDFRNPDELCAYFTVEYRVLLSVVGWEGGLTAFYYETPPPEEKIKTNENY